MFICRHACLSMTHLEHEHNRANASFSFLKQNTVNIKFGEFQLSGLEICNFS
jgi:hypothetical protein